MNEAFRALERLLEERRLAANREGVYAFQAENVPEDFVRVHATLDQAAPYYWAPEQCALVASIAGGVPDHWFPLRESCETDAGYFLFSTPFPVPPPVGMDEPAILGAMLWRWALDRNRRVHLQITLYVKLGDRDWFPVDTWIWPEGETLGAFFKEAVDGPAAVLVAEELGDLTRDLRVVGTRLVAAAFAFLEQRILVVCTQQAPRPIRRRHKLPPGQDIVRVVVLRRQQRIGAQVGEHPVEWSCQWIVRGHWRDQWFPKAQAHRPIWILPYGKGPETKPLKMPPVTVFSVTR